MTDTMIKVVMFLGDNGEVTLLREMLAEIKRDLIKAELNGIKWAEGRDLVQTTARICELKEKL